MRTYRRRLRVLLVLVLGLGLGLLRVLLLLLLWRGSRLLKQLPARRTALDEDTHIVVVRGHIYGSMRTHI